MATYVSYSPVTTIAKAMYNFDASGSGNFKYSGTIKVSLSDAFTAADYASSSFWSSLYTSGSSELSWTAEMQSNIQDVLQIFSQFAGVTFDWKGHYDNSPGSDSSPNPLDVGLAGLSDINISRIHRSDVSFGGVSGVDSDQGFGYVGGAGDIFLNDYGYGDLTFGVDTEARETLMHELGHSLGLSHPHVSSGAVTTDFSATKDVGFAQLGFHTGSGQEMDKEYFTIMSYDNQPYRAHTPMILDVIALEQAYGEGSGTSGAGNDTITAGTYGYRTYFDKGGTDTINLSLYAEDVHLQMGVHIAGASHLVGVAMGANDAYRVSVGEDPLSLRWFYGEFENADGSSYSDRLYGNDLNNNVEGRAGADYLFGLAGEDTLSGGDNVDVIWGGGGFDLIYGDGANDQLDGGEGYDVLHGGDGVDAIEGRSGVDTVYGGIGDDTLSGGDDTDFVSGGAGNDVIYGDGADDRLDGEDGNDVVYGGDGPDVIYGGAGSDRVDGQLGSDILHGGDEADTVEGGLGADTISGDSGADTLSGGGNSDLIFGGGGNDVIYGDGGSDTLVGGPGMDLLTGGPAPDRFDFDTLDGSTDSIADFSVGAGNDVIDLHDVLVGYNGNIDNFVRLQNGGSAVIVTVNADGLGGDYVSVVSLQGMTLTGTLLNDMLANGNLVV